MATKKVGELIKEARTNAGLSQEALARKIDGLSASDVGKVERGEKDLSQALLKEIAKATGVTQKSLLEAPKNISAKTSSAKTSSAKTSSAKTSSAKTSSAKTSSAKTSSAKTSSAKTSSAKTSSAKTSSAKKTTAAKKDAETLTAAEKKLVELYRAADSDTKKTAVAILKGEKPEDTGVLSSLLNLVGGSDLINGLLGNLKK